MPLETILLGDKRLMLYYKLSLNNQALVQQTAFNSYQTNKYYFDTLPSFDALNHVTSTGSEAVTVVCLDKQQWSPFNLLK